MKGEGVNTKTIKARRLTDEEVQALDTTEEILVSADSEYVQGTGCLAPAFLTRPGKEFEGGFYMIKTIFGESVNVSCSEDEVGIYSADILGDTIGDDVEVLQSAGFYVNLALFLPGKDTEALSKLFTAIRGQFGEGVVQKWYEDSSLVPDAKYDVYEVPSSRGRKPADGPKRVLIEGDVYQQYVEFVPIADGYKKSVQKHEVPEKRIPTI